MMIPRNKLVRLHPDVTQEITRLNLKRLTEKKETKPEEMK